MRRDAKTNRTLIWFITLALIGLTVLQFLLLRFAWELEDQAFVRNVDTALSLTVAQLESEEIFDGAVRLLELDEGGGVVSLDALRTIEFADAGDSEARAPLKRFYNIGDVCPDSVTIVDMPRVWRYARAGLDSLRTANGEDAAGETNILSIVVKTERTNLIQRIVGGLVEGESQPIRERLEESAIDSLLSENLRSVGIDVRPEYGIMATDTDSLVITSDQARPDALAASEYRTRLFPLDLAPPHYDLALHFPEERVYLAGRIWPFWLASIVFMSIVVAGFVQTLRVNAAQRRYAGHLVDFVNNMTHEFKTPISTVSLASEALSQDDITERPEALRRYNAMIRHENRRMAEQVEKILQIAQLESGDFALNLSPVDAHALLTDVAASFALGVEERGGKLDFVPAPIDARVMADDVHLAGALGNLLDNAVKHATDAPEITITTRNEGDALVVAVADRGPGIDEREHARVFEKYYRGHKGDRHDVKGFGLGLSYVKLVIEAHGGRVGLAARRGGGTTVTVRLPLLGADRSSKEGGIR